MKIYSRGPRQRGLIVKFHSLRNSLVGGVFALLAAMLLASCGGGGAATIPGNTGGILAINPASGTVYAGMPVTFAVTGGRKPYTLTSTEPALLSVPATLNTTNFTVVANNPGVVNVGLADGELPVRSVTINVRDVDGFSAASTVLVGQNFLTSYGISFSSTNCPPPTGTTTTTNPCSGGDTVVTLQATFNGNLAGDRQFRLINLNNAPYTLIVPATGVSDSKSIVINSDHAGNIVAIIRVARGVPTQVAVLRVQDVATGVYSDHAFVISGATSTLTAIPNTITFTGRLTTECGTGQADFLVFDGTPPYNATSTNPTIVVTPAAPATSDTNPGRFTVTANNPSVCSTSTIVVQDSLGARTLVTITTSPGTGAPPDTIVPLVVAPNQITLTCGQTASVSAIGGGTSTTPATTYSASSANPNLTVTVSGNAVSIHRIGTTPPGPVGATSPSTVTVTDGTQQATVTVTSTTTCAP
jgi:hypothetical protein